MDVAELDEVGVVVVVILKMKKLKNHCPRIWTEL